MRDRILNQENVDLRVIEFVSDIVFHLCLTSFAMIHLYTLCIPQPLPLDKRASDRRLLMILPPRSSPRHRHYSATLLERLHPQSVPVELY